MSQENVLPRIEIAPGDEDGDQVWAAIYIDEYGCITISHSGADLMQVVADCVAWECPVNVSIKGFSSNIFEPTVH
jgi:hypothetical protein